MNRPDDSDWCVCCLSLMISAGTAWLEGSDLSTASVDMLICSPMSMDEVIGAVREAEPMGTQQVTAYALPSFRRQGGGGEGGGGGGAALRGCEHWQALWR